MIFGKRGALGDGIMMMVRILLVVFIAFVIFGIASIFYTQYISVRYAEAAIMGRSVVDCLAPNGVFDMDDYPEDEKDKLLSHCGFDGADFSRIFVRVIFYGDGGELARLYQGDL
jgi:hypothetical protein